MSKEINSRVSDLISSIVKESQLWAERTGEKEEEVSIYIMNQTFAQLSEITNPVAYGPMMDFLAEEISIRLGSRLRANPKWNQGVQQLAEISKGVVSQTSSCSNDYKHTIVSTTVNHFRHSAF
jgi:hypothetical protein